MDKTLAVCIGNSDNKLTQQEWSIFCSRLRFLFDGMSIHFFGNSPGDAPWQNALCFVVVPETSLARVKEDLASLALKHNQEGIALLVGDTEIIPGDLVCPECSKEYGKEVRHFPPICYPKEKV